MPIRKVHVIKWLKRILLSTFLMFSLGVFIAHVVFPNQFIELKVLIHKYTDLNIRQNTGVHKYALIFIRKMSFILPNLKETLISREDFQPGIQEQFTHHIPDNYVASELYFVSTELELLQALRQAKAGSVITIEPGEYKIIEKVIKVGYAGEVYKPITLRAANYGTVTLILGTQQGFLIDKPFWTFENLIIKGECTTDSWCEHAFHLVGDADHIIIRNNYIANFNAHIKSNGLTQKLNKSKRHFPDSVKLLNNTFINEWKRNTKNSVTPIDVVGGEHWLIKHNFIADFGKNGQKGKGVTYGAFLKGGGKYGTIEENLVACAWKVPHTSTTDIRIGLSLGGGGTGQKYCDNKECRYEHDSGIIRNNVVLNCFNDVGLYLNKARNSQVYGNQIYGSLGIDVRFPESSATFYNNKISGRIKSRDEASIAFDN